MPYTARCSQGERPGGKGSRCRRCCKRCFLQACEICALIDAFVRFYAPACDVPTETAAKTLAVDPGDDDSLNSSRSQQASASASQKTASKYNLSF